MLINREVILAKRETTYNQDANPTAANDAMLVENISKSNEGLRMTERPGVRASIGALQHVFGNMLGAVSFDAEIKGSGVAGTAPEIGAFLRGCAFGEIIAAGVSVTYKPVSSGHESLTLYYYQDGILTKMTGAVGTVSMAFEAGVPGKASFTFTGHVSTPTDTPLVAPSFDTVTPEPFVGASFVVDSFAATIGKLDFDMSNTIAMPPDVSAADGFGKIQITARDVSGSIDPQLELISVEAFEANMRSGKKMALATGVIGSTPGNRYAVSMPAIYYRDLSAGDREGIRTLEASFGAVEASTDDEVSLVFT